jgi:hypothetical protein
MRHASPDAEMLKSTKVSSQGRILSVPRGKPSPKVAITVDPDVYAAVVAAARTEGVSISAWLTQAARGALRVRAGLAAVAEFERRYGAFTDEDMKRAHERVGAQLGRRRRR